jgi:hypothetical protein
MSKIKNRLTELEAGDEVWCGGSSGFCDDSIEKIVKTTQKYDENSGEPYKVIWLSGGRKFDSRDGFALTPPLAYHIETAPQDEETEDAVE